MFYETTILLLASALSITATVSHAARVMRTKCVDGISLSAIVIGNICSGAWLGYGILHHDIALIVVDIAWCLSQTYQIWAIVRASTKTRIYLLLLVCLPALALTALTKFEFLAVLGSIAGLTSTSCYLPQVIRTIRSTNNAGLSVVGYTIEIVESLVWLIHGLAYHEYWLVFGCAGAVICCFIIAIRTLLTRSTPNQSIKEFSRAA